MKKIIILTIATLSTGIVLSSSLRNEQATIKPVVLPAAQKSTMEVNRNKDTKISFDALATAD